MRSAVAVLLLAAALPAPAAEPVPACAELRDYVHRIRIVDDARDTVSFGSAFFASVDGLLLTALHLFEDAPGAAEAFVEVDDGTARSDCPVNAVLAFSRRLDFVLARAELGANRVKAPPAARKASRGSPVFGFRVSPSPPPSFRASDGISCSRGVIAAVTRGEISIRGEVFFTPGSSGSPVLDGTGRVVSMALEMVNWKPPGEAPDWTYQSLPVATALAAPRLRAPITVRRLSEELKSKR